MLGHYCLRTFVGELGDKTFFVTAAFAAWCPWEGTRSHGERVLQMGLVFAGSFTALMLRTILLVTTMPPRYWDWVCDCVSCALLLALGIKAKLELSRLEAATPRPSSAIALAAADLRSRMKQEDPETLEGAAAAEPQWNKDAFSSMPPLTPADATDYGSMKSLSQADGVLSERISDRLLSHVLAFLSPMVLCYFVEAEDKSSAALLHRSVAHNAEIAVGAILGSIVAVMLAVFLGFVLERQLLDQRLLFTVSGIFFVISFISLSQALLHLNAASAEETVSASQVLLSVYRAVHASVDKLRS